VHLAWTQEERLCRNLEEMEDVTREGLGGECAGSRYLHDYYCRMHFRCDGRKGRLVTCPAILCVYSVVT